MTRTVQGGSISRRTLATLILSLWVLALGWLVERHYLGGGPKDEASRWPVPPGSSFQAIRLGERQVGLRTFSIDTLESGLRMVELITLDMPSPNQARRRTSLRVQQVYSRGLQLQNFRLHLLTEGGREERSGEVVGDSLLVLVNAPESTAAETLQIHLRRPIVLSSAIPLVIASRGLPKVGDRLNAEVFDPVNMVLELERFTVAAESVFVVPDSAEYNANLKRWSVVHTDTVRAWRIDHTADGLPVSRWIDAVGMLVRTQYPLGAVMDRSAFEMVQTNFRAVPTPTWDRHANAPQFLPDSSVPRVRKGLRVLAQLGIPTQALPASIAALEGGWQTRSGDTIRVGAREVGSTSDSAPDSKAAPIWSLFQPDSSLRNVAMRASGKESRAEAVAASLNTWVNRNIAHRRAAGMRSAAAVLATRQGNDVERVLLLTALSQAAGLPARPVWGLVQIDGQWQLRSWAEIWADHWVPFDPAIGRGQDAGRVRLATGGAGRLMDLALRAGRVRLDVLEELR